MIVEYWSDFTCPFCYIAETRLKKVLKDLEIEKETKIIFKAFELNPQATREPKRNMVEGFAHHYMMPMEMARERVGYICEMGRAEGLVFNYDTARNSNTFDSLRLTKLAQSKGNDFGNAFIERMYKAFFEDNIILADQEKLLKIALEMGLGEDETKELLTGDRYAEEVRRDEYEARSFGIQAVPYFVINRRYGISGAKETRDMKRIVMRAYNEEEMESTSSGMTCGPDGCHPAER